MEGGNDASRQYHQARIVKEDQRDDGTGAADAAGQETM